MKLKLLSNISIFLGLCIVLNISPMNKQLFKKNLFKKNLLNAKIISSSPKRYYNNASLFSSSGAIKQESLNNKSTVSKKIVPNLQQKREFSGFGFSKKSQKEVPSFGFFRTRTLVDHKQSEKIITIDPDSPKSEKQVLDIINTLKEQPLEGKRFYSGIPWKPILKGAAGGLGFLVAGIAAGVAYLYDRFINIAHESKAPLSPTQETYRYPEKFYKYALDGEMARTMSPLDLVKELHRDGLTSEDPPRIQCQIQEDEIFQKIIDLAKLSEHDQKLLQNIRNLRHSFFNGHYNKNNITYQGTFDQSLKQIIESALEKADIPFKIRIIDESLLISEDDLAAAGCGSGRNLKFKYHMATGSAELKKNTLDAFIYISPSLKLQSPLVQKASIAHEVTHTLNLHNLQTIFFNAYLLDIKKVDVNILKGCNDILSIIKEYQADTFPLANLDYAQAQKLKFESYEGANRPDIYIPTRKMVELSSRAVKLHEAEKKLKESATKSKSSWGSYFGFEIKEAHN